SSSWNSIFARSSKSSPAAGSPFGIVHAPASLFRQNGPPGCTSNTSTRAAVRRNMSRPALCFISSHSERKRGTSQAFVYASVRFARRAFDCEVLRSAQDDTARRLFLALAGPVIFLGRLEGALES